MSHSYSGGSFAKPKDTLIERFVVVTGGSGRVGRATVALLKAQEPKIFVISLDTALPAADSVQPDEFVKVELEDYGQTLAALIEVDTRYALAPKTAKLAGIVHMAANPSMGSVPNHVIYRSNTLQTYNILEAARVLGYDNVVLASSETLIGWPLDPVKPDRLPITEEQPPRPESSYSLSKLLGETMASEFCRWDPKLKIVSLRFSNVMEPVNYADFLVWTEEQRTSNAFGYIDSRDAASSILASLNHTPRGHHFYLIANDDTVSPSAATSDLVKKHFPNVPWEGGWTAKGGEGEEVKKFEGLLSTEKARRELGWRSVNGWRGQVKGEAHERL